MEEKKVCPVCKKHTDASIINVCTAAYEYVIRRIKSDHPDWVEKDGVCPKCVDYYKRLPSH